MTKKLGKNLWKKGLGKGLSGTCLYLPFFYEHLKNPSDSVCDVGCGSLFYLEAVVDILKKEFCLEDNPMNSFKSYVGVDISEEVLELAKKRAEKYGIKNKAKFIQADLRSLPFQEGSFESVICIETLPLLGKEYKKGLEEIVRIAKKEVYLSITKIDWFSRIIGSSVDGGWLMSSKYPHPIFASTEKKFKKILDRYGSVKGLEIHPCLSIPSCFPERLLFKIEKGV